MVDIPHQTLSEHVSDRLSGYVVKVAVFLTFEFEPTFFEDNILPVLLQAPLSQVPKIRRVQLEEAIAQGGLQLGVYYDARALVLGEGSACLDSRRIPLRHKAFFHSKLILVLGERKDEQGMPEKHLFVGTPSANLTENGWWKNVEVCHFERLSLDEKSFIAAPLAQYLKEVRHLGDSRREHEALDAIRKFLKEVPQAQQKSRNGVLLTQFFGGTASFPEFLARATQGSGSVAGMHLEIISPFINEQSLGCLDDLIQATQPATVTLAQLRRADGKCSVAEPAFRAIESHPHARWGELISSGLGLGRDVAARRNVHAKVYRFWQKRPKREVLFVGSTNLTRPAHQKGGNHECGFLVEVERPSGGPWLTSEAEPPTAFVEEDESQEELGSEGRHAGSQAEIRFDWRATPPAGWLRWAGAKTSGALTFRAQGKGLFGRSALSPKEDWNALLPEENSALESLLKGTSVLEVVGEEPERSTYVLVQEENMSHKPSLFCELTLAEILKYWSLLTTDQKENFLERRLLSLLAGAEGGHLAVLRERHEDVETMFDRVAGVYHAFAQLENHVRQALAAKNTKIATYLLFGQKFDSLPPYLDGVATSTNQDPIDRYLSYRCALQVCREIQKTKEGTKLWNMNPDAVSHLDAAMQRLSGCREALLEESADLGEFLDWFDAMFDERAVPLEVSP